MLELIGGILLVIGLLTRLAALLLAVDLAVAILLVKVNLGLIAEMGVGAELDVALIAGFLALVFLGPGRLSIDHALGIERERNAGLPGARAGDAPA